MPKIATKGDKVVGTDTHIVMVPSPSGATPTPLPHPFQGTIDGGCSSVTINGRPIAVAGCTATNDKPHTPTPPGTSFQKPPSNKARVVTSAMPLIEINGKPVVVEGSPAITCNDPVDAPTGVVQVIHEDTWGIEPNLDFKPFLMRSFKLKKQVEKTLEELTQLRKEKLKNITDPSYKKKLAEEFEIVSIRIYDEPVTLYDEITVTVKKKGICIAPMFLRMFLIDEKGNVLDTGIERKIGFGGSLLDIAAETFPPLKPEVYKDFSFNRLFVGFDVYCKGKPFRLMESEELTEVFYRGKIDLSSVYHYLYKEKKHQFSQEEMVVEITDGWENEVEFSEKDPLVMLAKKVHCCSFKVVKPVEYEFNPFKEPERFLFSHLNLNEEDEDAGK